MPWRCFLEQLVFKIEIYEGPLDLLLSLIAKHKMDIKDIKISLIFEQYMEYVETMQRMDMEIAGEFITMASELMLIKSKMLLPKAEPEEEDPRAALAEALLKFQQAKNAAVILAKAYPTFSGRMVKDTDEISVDKTFVADQSVTSLCLAVRRIIAYREEHPSPNKVTFTPMIAKPIVPVEAKIVGILKHFDRNERVSLSSLLEDSVSLPDMIAIFLGVLELMKMRRIVLLENHSDGSVFGIETEFLKGEDPVSEDETPPPEEPNSDTNEQEVTAHAK